MKRNSYIFILWILTALLAVYISVVYIPPHMKAVAIDKVTLRQIVPERGDYVLYLGDQLTVSYSCVPATAISRISFASSDTGVASVDDNGTVTGNTPGTAQLTISGKPGVQTTVSVSVIRKPVPPGSGLPELYYDRPVVINLWNTVSADWVPPTVPIPRHVPVNKPSMTMTAETLAAYEQMYKAAKAATGRSIIVVSGYRSYATQSRLFSEKVAQFTSGGYSLSAAQAMAGRTVQPPGSSEHQTGLAVDIGDSYSLSYTFQNTSVGAWVTNHAHEYGFILRYPADKTAQTGISYEPWHFRYVGVEHAAYIKEHGLCLEEYIELQQQAEIAAAEYAKLVPATL